MGNKNKTSLECFGVNVNTQSADYMQLYLFIGICLFQFLYAYKYINI